MVKIPKIDRGILSSILVEIDGPQRDPNWAENIFTCLKISNPILAEYIAAVKHRQQLSEDKYDEHAALTGLVIFRLIESQMEADELEALFS